MKPLSAWKKCMTERENREAHVSGAMDALEAALNAIRPAAPPNELLCSPPKTYQFLNARGATR